MGPGARWPQELSPGDQTLMVQGVSRADTGNYQCETRDLVSKEQSEVISLTMISEYRLLWSLAAQTRKQGCLWVGASGVDIAGTL